MSTTRLGLPGQVQGGGLLPGGVAPFSPDQAGQMAAGNLQGLAEVAEQGLNVLGDMVLKEMNEINATKTAEANIALMRELNDLKENPESGYANKIGGQVVEIKDANGNVVPLTQNYFTQAEERRAKIRAGLTNDRQRQQFDLQTGEVMERFRGSLMNHEREQTTLWKVDTAKTQIATNLLSYSDRLQSTFNAARTGAMDYADAEAEMDALTDGVITEITAGHQRLAELEGRSLESANIEQRKSIGAFAGSLFNQAVNNQDTAAAAAILGRFSGFLMPEVYDKMSATVAAMDERDTEEDAYIDNSSIDANTGMPVRFGPRDTPSIESFNANTTTAQMVDFTWSVESGRSNNPRDNVNTNGTRDVGPMQINEATAERAARMAGVPYDRSKLRDPEYNKKLGTAYLEWLTKRYDGDKFAALVGYQQGEGNVDNARIWSRKTGRPWWEFFAATGKPNGAKRVKAVAEHFGIDLSGAANSDKSRDVIQEGGSQQTVAESYGPNIEAIATQAVPGVVITSRERSQQKNAQVGGVADSYHTSDDARDFVPPAGMSMAQLHSQLKAQFPGYDVINEGDHIHVEPGPGMPKSKRRGGPGASVNAPVYSSSMGGRAPMTPAEIQADAEARFPGAHNTARRRAYIRGKERGMKEAEQQRNAIESDSYSQAVGILIQEGGDLSKVPQSLLDQMSPERQITLQNQANTIRGSLPPDPRATAIVSDMKQLLALSEEEFQGLAGGLSSEQFTAAAQLRQKAMVEFAQAGTIPSRDEVREHFNSAAGVLKVNLEIQTPGAKGGKVLRNIFEVPEGLRLQSAYIEKKIQMEKAQGRPNTDAEDRQLAIDVLSIYSATTDSKTGKAYLMPLDESKLPRPLDNDSGRILYGASGQVIDAGTERIIRATEDRSAVAQSGRSTSISVTNANIDFNRNVGFLLGTTSPSVAQVAAARSLTKSSQYPSGGDPRLLQTLTPTAINRQIATQNPATRNMPSSRSAR